MARRPISQRFIRARLELLLDEMTPQLAAAFRASIDDITSNVSLQRLVDAIERRDYEAAIRELYIEAAAFRPLDRAISAAYDAGGVDAVATLPALTGPNGGRLVIRFDGRNPRAERWLARHSSQLITGITQDMRIAARQHLVAGMQAGVNPRTSALSLVGRIDRATGRRVNGVIGLTSSQERFVATAREDLLSGDPSRLRHYLTLNRRDRRFDRTILAAIRDSKPIDAATVERITGRLSDSYLSLRGEVVARTESLTALNASRREAFEQAVEQGGLDRRNIVRYWSAAQDVRTRDTHSAMHGQEVGMDEPFVSPSGARMMYPGDTSLGASPSETIQCRCFHGVRVKQFVSELE